MSLKSTNSKFNFDNLVKILFLLGTFVVGCITIFYVILASMYEDGLKTAFFGFSPNHY